tara:strand:+ start:4375 stop:4836 length:462 start_codon:yes stop_codon:yes gene_type:complete
MAGFLSSSQISEIESLYGTLHETFSQKITVYKNGKKTLIAHDPKYNSIYSRNDLGKRDSVEYTVVSETFDARIYYIKTEEEFFNNYKSQTKVILPKGSVKVVVKKEAFDYIQEARRVEFDGRRFTIHTDGAPYGLTSNLFYTFYFTPLDEATD